MDIEERAKEYGKSYFGDPKDFEYKSQMEAYHHAVGHFKAGYATGHDDSVSMFMSDVFLPVDVQSLDEFVNKNFPRMSDDEKEILRGFIHIKSEEAKRGRYESGYAAGAEAKEKEIIEKLKQIAEEAFNKGGDYWLAVLEKENYGTGKPESFEEWFAKQVKK